MKHVNKRLNILSLLKKKQKIETFRIATELLRAQKAEVQHKLESSGVDEEVNALVQASGLASDAGYSAIRDAKLWLILDCQEKKQVLARQLNECSDVIAQQRNSLRTKELLGRSYKRKMDDCAVEIRRLEQKIFL